MIMREGFRVPHAELLQDYPNLFQCVLNPELLMDKISHFFSDPMLPFLEELEEPIFLFWGEL